MGAFSIHVELMLREEFRALIENKIVLLDGATGSNLLAAGMPKGVCPEKWILEHPEVLVELQKSYIKAGTDILYTPTFTGNRIKLSEYGLADKIESMNHALAGLSKQAIKEAGVDRPVYIAGDLTMTGEQLYPIGTLLFEELVEVYKEQVRYLVEAGVDLFVVETMMSINECRAAVLAVKETCDLPVMVTMTFKEDMRTFYGTDPVTALITLQSMGVDAVGANCSTGPDRMIELIRQMKQYATVPIICKPNAGLPKLVDGKTVYDMDADQFAAEMKVIVETGASIIGGCCGTTPEYIRLVADAVREMKSHEIRTGKIRALTTERSTKLISLDSKFMVVGERINPTGKKALQAELRAGEVDLVAEMACEQMEHGADILDVNMGINGIDEKEMMCKSVYEIMMSVDAPLSIDSSHIDVIEAALRIYPGRALINSICLEDEKIERLLPIAKKYGAMFIILPLSGAGLPKDWEEKRQILHTIMDAAFAIGLTKEDIVVDGLVATVGANKNAALEAMETIRYCKEELQVATICGLSNISFGLPERQSVNSVFLACAISAGLTMAIANPAQDLLMNTAFAADLLMNKEEADIRYIQRVTEHPIVVTTKEKMAELAAEQNGGSSANGAAAGTGEAQSDGKCSPHQVGTSTSEASHLPTNEPVYQAVLKGNRKHMVELVDVELKKGKSPQEIINTLLIPAISEVGDLFEKQVYFLPQLISSAEAMRTAIDYLEPMLEVNQSGEKLGTIVIATVAGDIHDIGKNLVALMLKNYGFDVTDLGKDVPSEKIIEVAREKDADIIALSALMTTTMVEMKTVVDLVREANLRAKVIIGGAVITPSYATEIEADGYSKDANEAVVLVKRLLNLTE